ncbi:MAG: hypothetical protein ACRC6V_07960 [Bacteroidales bacterium]
MDRAKVGLDNSLFRTPKERLGQAWSHTRETQAKLAADMAAEKNEVFLAPEYDTKPSQNAGALRPKNTKHGLQQNNGRRTQCQGYKAGAKVGNERKLPPLPKDYVAVARAKRIKKHTSKLRAAPTKKI